MLILIDDAPVGDPSGIGGIFYIRNIATYQIDRIEIIKGVHSTLLGSKAVAGVINIITKASTPSTRLSASYESLAQHKSSITISHSLSDVIYSKCKL